MADTLRNWLVRCREIWRWLLDVEIRYVDIWIPGAPSIGVAPFRAVSIFLDL